MAQTPRICLTLMETGATDINTDPGCYMAMGPDPGLQQQPGTRRYDSLGWGSTGHSDLYGSSCSMVSRSQQIVAQPWASSQSLVAIWAMNFNTYPSCGRTMGSDLLLGTRPGLEITMAPVASWLLDTIMPPGGSPFSGNPYDLDGNRNH